MKSVCIIGAGPGGLAAAKIFLQTKKFDVTVYEKGPRIGGIWALDEDSKDGFLSPQTPTNLSRFTVGFSDLDWSSVDVRSKLSKDSQPENSTKGAAPMFPKAWQVNKYLEAYREKYIPEGTISFNQEVTKVSRVKDASVRWDVSTKTINGESSTRSFDRILVTTGFFSKPRELNQTVRNIEDKPNSTMIHSSQFRTLEDLFSSKQDVRGKSILLIGGGNSAGEAAAAIAMQLSDAQWSTDQSQKDKYEGCKIIHVLPRPLYGLPPYNEYDKDSKTYVPLDLKLYDYSRRPPGPIEAYGGEQPKEVRDIVHGAIQTMAGGDQSELGAEALVSGTGDARGTAYVALSESYSEFVRSGLIVPIAGRVTALKNRESSDTTAAIKKDGKETALEDIAAVVYATGYTPLPALTFLNDDEDLKNDLQFHPTNMRLPIVLQQWQTMNPAVPELAFLGFYEGPYWPMIEMQARLTANRWLHDTTAPVKYFETPSALQEMRKAMQARDPGIPQYWFGDYLGYMEDISSFLSLAQNNSPFKDREGCTSPARYTTPQTDKSEADAIMQDLHNTWKACITAGRYVPRAAFRALHGNWAINRRIVSSDQNFSGVLEGTASFHPRYPTSDKSGQVFDFEYLYIESGSFKSAAGFTMTATRRYVYRYAEATDQLSVWFVKPDKKALDVDYLFHNLDFVPPEEAREKGACIARADHLCVEDMYWTEYRLPLKGVALLEFEMRHKVQGPKKDYVATTEYKRIPKGE